MIDMPSLAVLVAIASLALAALCAGVALRLVRQRRGIVEQAKALAGDVERLNDRLWELADSEERYRSLIEAQGDLIVRRSEGRIIYANAAYAALLGRDEAGVVGRPDLPTVLASGPLQVRADGARVVDERVATPEGERWFSWVETAVPVVAGQTVLQRVGRDITARIAGERALEEARRRAEEASAAKSRFLATVSHEFRTPLNGILGMTELLGDTRPSPEQATYLRALRISGEALLGLVDDILDFAKVEAGKLELAQQPFDLALIVEDVTELMAPRAQAKGIEVSALLAPDLPARLIGDADRLRQILLNLVGNAVKFTMAGGVGIEAAAEGDRLTIAIADTGPGIPADRLAAVFEEFEQAAAGIAHQQGGTGLGLAIARRLALAMGGDLTAANRAGGGALFRLALPLRAQAGAAAEPLPADWAGRRFLVASASPFGAGHLETCLARRGAGVVRAGDHAAALAALAAGGAFDAVLVDAALAGGEVAAVAAAARQAGAREVLVMLAPSERRGFGSPVAAGFTGFLVKPVRARSLYARLEAVEPPAAAREAAAPAAVARELPGLKVLVAEDNEINALLATRTLERLGCEPTWARDGGEAIRLVEAALAGQRPGFDLALLDIRMPELDGLSVTRLIRAAEQAAGAGRLPIIAVTANTADEDRRAALASGMDDCLAKPLSRDHLRAWVDRLSAAAGAPIRCA